MLSPKFFCLFFLSLFSGLLTYTNPTILMGARQQALTHPLLRPFGPFDFYNHRTNQKIYHHCNSHGNHAIILFVVVSQINQEYIARIRCLPEMFYHTFLVF